MPRKSRKIAERLNREVAAFWEEPLTPDDSATSPSGSLIKRDEDDVEDEGGMVKKTLAKPLSNGQLRTFASLIFERRRIIMDKDQGTVPSQLKTNAWKEIMEEFNGRYSWDQRDLKYLKKRWETLKSQAVDAAKTEYSSHLPPPPEHIAILVPMFRASTRSGVVGRQPHSNGGLEPVLARLCNNAQGGMEGVTNGTAYAGLPEAEEEPAYSDGGSREKRRRFGDSDEFEESLRELTASHRRFVDAALVFFASQGSLSDALVAKAQAETELAQAQTEKLRLEIEQARAAK